VSVAVVYTVNVKILHTTTGLASKQQNLFIPKQEDKNTDALNSDILLPLSVKGP
jgi:hypothetical protein